jgi:predicted alpha/beta-fold hydrolase
MTIYANTVRLPLRLPVRRERWELPDGDFLDVDRVDARAADAPLVVICHGLEGSSKAGYVRGLQAELRARGVASAALNFRGCSDEPNRLPRLYHSGETGDLGYAIERLVAERPHRRIGLFGVSLGGNVVMKHLAERGERAEAVAAAAVSVPFDLDRCALTLDGPGVFAWIYRQRFLRRLRPKALAKAHRFPGLLDEARVRRARLLREYDDAVTAPLHGFASAADYYARCSSGPLLPGVRRPSLLISAFDDPFIPGESIPVATIRANQALTLELYDQGGHVGFLAGAPWSPLRYAERRAAEFLAEHLER